MNIEFHHILTHDLITFPQHYILEPSTNIAFHHIHTHNVMQFQHHMQIKDFQRFDNLFSYMMKKRHFIKHANKVMRKLFDFSSNVVQMSTPKQFRILMQSIDDKSR